MSYGLFFSARDEEGHLFPNDIIFLESLAKDAESTLINVLGLDPVKDRSIIKVLKKGNKKPPLDIYK